MAVRKTTSKLTKRTPAKSKTVAAKKRPVKRKKAAKKPPISAVVATPVLSIPVVTPVLQAAPTKPAYKEIGVAPASRAKLWLTVGVSMMVIVSIWAYALSQSMFFSNALQDSSDQMQLGNFVDSVSNDLEDLKTQTNTFVDQTQNKNVTVTPDASSGEQPSNAELDNLFSDL